MKIIITLALLFSFAFSAVHEFAYAMYDENHCSVSEYVDELGAPSECGDICDTHFEYHHSYVLPFNNILLSQRNLSNKPTFYKESYSFLMHEDLVIPPIS